MICASCGAERDEVESACVACRGPTLLQERYRLERVLGGSAAATTYAAVRVADGVRVCVKELRYGGMGTFAPEKLFRREAALLRQLSHPAIPAYLDDFVAGSGRTLALYLVQEYVAGRSLKEELRDHRFAEDEVLAVVDELLVVLAYLHGLSPPVVHRDLKPANVMRRDADRGLVLVDFGSARDAVRERGGSTIAGTFGYMAPEQFRGDATPATDLYGLGALAVALLAHREADALVGDDHRLAWHRHVEVRPATARLLDGLLEPDPTRRTQTALEAAQLVAAARRGARAAAPAAAPARRAGSTVRLSVIAACVAFVLGAAALLALVRAPEPARRPPPYARRVRHPERVDPHVVPEAILGAAPARPGSQPASTSAASVALPPTCDGTPCEPVPRGLKGARFGMTVAEATAALGEHVSALEPLTLPERRPGERERAEPGTTAPVRVVAKRLKVPTTLLGEPATCELRFAVGERLSQMVCTLLPAAEGGALDPFGGLEQALLKSLRGRYGTEHRRREDDAAVRETWRGRRTRYRGPAPAPTPHGLPLPRGPSARPRPGSYAEPAPPRRYSGYSARYEWRDEAARLELRAIHGLPPRFEVVNTSAEHDALLRRLATEAWRAKDL